MRPRRLFKGRVTSPPRVHGRPQPPGAPRGDRWLSSFSKWGALLLGSGMIVYAFIESEVVTLGWLTQDQLIDAVATVDMFLPPFVTVPGLSPSLPRIRR